jgi:DNA-binding transcriptional regulator LsrR (DeoR family)
MTERIDITTTLIEVAHLYYEENLSQQQIADRLHVSRSLIALYIKKARDMGIVRIEILDPKDSHTKLATQLREKFGLSYANVVSSAHNSAALTRRALGNAAAAFITEHLKDGDVLGLGWGRTVMEVANLIAPEKPYQINVVPLQGESSYTDTYSQLNQIIMQVAKRFGGLPHFLFAPILVGSQNLRNAFMNDESARNIIDLWDSLDIVCEGIGSVPPSEGQIVYIGEENMSRLQNKGAKGDICARYYNQKGRFIEDQINDRLISISLEQMRKAKMLIAVAGGAEKASATLSALRTGLVSALFIDEAMAQILITELDD